MHCTVYDLIISVYFFFFRIGVQVSNGDVCDLTANNFPDNMIELLKGGKKSLFMAER